MAKKQNEHLDLLKSIFGKQAAVDLAQEGDVAKCEEKQSAIGAKVQKLAESILELPVGSRAKATERVILEIYNQAACSGDKALGRYSEAAFVFRGLMDALVETLAEEMALMTGDNEANGSALVVDLLGKTQRRRREEDRLRAAAPLIEKLKVEAERDTPLVAECPVCGGVLHYSVCSINDHAHMHCETIDCVDFIE